MEYQKRHDARPHGMPLGTY